ncbi:hypothetical protein NC652_013396 [Populus alba x Populus x berolinensis]|nr:hypothetical protein NC652_013396 [Populus alba x Populus x berolinensis]
MDSTKNDAPDGKTKGRFCLLASGALIFVGIAILLYLTQFQPHKPRFIIQDARNPNAHIGIYYEKLDVHAIYQHQQITLATALPRTYLDHEEVSVWSPVLYGKDVAISPLVATGLMEDLQSGCVSLDIKVYGRLKWKLGSSMIGKYQLIANCPAYIPLGNPSKMESAAKYEFVHLCKVKVE